MGCSIRTRTCVHAAAAMLVLWLVAGCATTNATKLSDAALSGDPDAMWSEGQELARKGERKIKKGEERMADGRRQVRDGEAKIRDGSERSV